jgi:DNA excision repair protein ERCC-4
MKLTILRSCTHFLRTLREAALITVHSFAKQDVNQPGALPSLPRQSDPTAHDEELALALSMSTVEEGLAFTSEFDQVYGLLPPQTTVLVRAYSDDSDDRLLAELQPRFIVMYEPSHEFIRRMEVRLVNESVSSTRLNIKQVYKSSNPGLSVRVYFMIYQSSSEEHKYLAGLRKEKDSFESLIKERGVCDP